MTSWVNRELFFRDIRRSWPVWGGMCLSYALFFLTEAYGYTASYLGFFHMAAISVAACAADYLLVLVVFGFTGGPREAYFFHAVPLSRGSLFLTKTLACAAAAFIPALAISALCLPLGGAPAAMSALILTAMHLAYLGMALPLVMLTGHPAAYLSVAVLLQFAANFLSSSLGSLFYTFLYGFPGFDNAAGKADWWALLSPARHFFHETVELPGTDTFSGAPPPLPAVMSVVLAGAGILCGGAAYFLFKRRRAESAGSFAAFPFIKPLFKYALTASASILLTRFMVWALYADQMPRENLPLLIGTVVFNAALGYFTAEMLIQKRVNVFGNRKSLAGFAAAAAVMAGLTAILVFDLFGYGSYIPPIGEIESVTQYAVSQNARDIEANLALHEFITRHKALTLLRDPPASEILPYGPGSWEWFYVDSHYANGVGFRYTLKNGDTMFRWYNTSRLLEDPELAETFSALYYARRRADVLASCESLEAADDHDYLEARVIRKGQQPQDAEVVLGPEASENLFRAAMADIRDGHFYLDEFAPPTRENPGTLLDDMLLIMFHGEHPLFGPGASINSLRQAHFDTRAEHLLAALAELGIEVN